MSKPEIKIKGKVQNMEKKEKNVKPKVSNFLLTINTNQQYKPEDEHLADDILKYLKIPLLTSLKIFKIMLICPMVLFGMTKLLKTSKSIIQ